MEQITYKSVGAVELKLHLFRPAATAAGLRSAIVFFFGGGWTTGSPGTFYPHCRHLAELGMVAVAAEYRVRDRHGTSAFECVADGKSAVRWLRAHAAEFGIDPHRIAAGGGSAGGHVAACAATITGGEDETGFVSSQPDALVLFNPAVDATLAMFADRFAGRATEISPVHHVRPGQSPTIIFHGTEDKIVPYENVERFTRLMTAAGNRCELVPFPGKEHGFYHYGDGTGSEPYHSTIAATDQFLSALGFIS
ncbi:MAG: alpha/beta hydrolase [Verrucomicrobiota bacterium]